MIRNIINLLKTNDYYYVSDTIDIAKGYKKAPENINEIKDYLKRKKGYGRH